MCSSSSTIFDAKFSIIFGAKDRVINWGPGVVSVKVAPTLHNETSHLRRASQLQSRLIPIQTATEASRRPLWGGRSRQGRRESSPTRRGGSLISGIGCATCQTSSIFDVYAFHQGYFGHDDIQPHNLPIHEAAPSVGASSGRLSPAYGVSGGRDTSADIGLKRRSSLLPSSLPPSLISIHPSKRKKCQWRFSPPHKYGPSLVMREGGGHLPCRHPRVS